MRAGVRRTRPLITLRFTAGGKIMPRSTFFSSAFSVHLKWSFIKSKVIRVHLQAFYQKKIFKKINFKVP
jgi:hypothetical protein